MEIYRFSVSPKAFLKLSIIVIALLQKGLSCPSLAVGHKQESVVVKSHVENEKATLKIEKSHVENKILKMNSQQEFDERLAAFP